MGIDSALSSGISSIPVAGPILGGAINAVTPVDISGAQQAEADSRELEKMFLAQMGQYQPTPGLSYGGSAPVSYAPSGVPGQPAPAMAQTAPAGGLPAPTGAPGAPLASPTAGAAAAAAGLTKGLSPTGGPGGAAPNPVGSAIPSPGAPSPGAPAPAARGWNPAAFGSAMGASVAGVPWQPGGVFGQYQAAAPGQAAADPGLGGLPGSITPNGVPDAPGMTAAAMMAAQMQAAPDVQGQAFGGAVVDPTQQAQFRAGQMGLVGNLQDAIAGNAPSVAQLQQQRAFGQLAAQQLGTAAAMGRGGNQALALRSALGNMGRMGAQQASDAALLRAQETTAARGQLGDVLNSGRGADLGLASQNAQMQQQALSQNAQLAQQAALQNQQNAQAAASQNALLQQQAGQTNAQNLQAANAANQQAQQAARTQNIQQQSNQANQALQANANMGNAAAGAIAAQTQQKQQTGNILSTGLSLLSDERVKTDVRPAGGNELRDFLEALRPSAYRYQGSPEPKVGVMAQDVSRSAVGRTLVRETPAGKAIDIPSATGAMLAALADLNRRTAALEGR